VAASIQKNKGKYHEIHFSTNDLLGLLAGTTTAYAGGEVKEVCKEVEKKGKKVQECKKVKVHKKVDGEKVPDGKKK